MHKKQRELRRRFLARYILCQRISVEIPSAEIYFCQNLSWNPPINCFDEFHLWKPTKFSGAKFVPCEICKLLIPHMYVQLFFFEVLHRGCLGTTSVVRFCSTPTLCSTTQRPWQEWRPADCLHPLTGRKPPPPGLCIGGSQMLGAKRQTRLGWIKFGMGLGQRCITKGGVWFSDRGGWGGEVRGAWTGIQAHKALGFCAHYSPAQTLELWRRNTPIEIIFNHIFLGNILYPMVPFGFFHFLKANIPLCVWSWKTPIEGLMAPVQ